MVLNPFCATGYINDPWYLPGDEDSSECRGLSPREAIALPNCAAPRSEDDYRRPKISHMVALRNKKVGEELLVDYGMKYSS